MNDFREIRELFDMEYWLERDGVEFRKSRGSSGMQLNIKECPCCGDRRWRVYLNADTGAGNCFVCNETFSKAKFVEHQTGLAWQEVRQLMREVALEQGWRPKHKTGVAVEIETPEVKLPASYELPTRDGQTLTYLDHRGVTPENCGYFHLRYCDTGWWNYTDENGERRGQAFDDRVIIPVFDLDGTLTTFQGRDITGKAERKYLFPKGLPGTGRYLYNGQNANRAKRLVMGEGAFDVFAIKNALDEEMELRDVVPVGSFGKHLSYGSLDGNDQLGRFIQLKQQGLEQVTIMWDGEWRAIVSALDAATLLSRIGIQARIALLPSEKDPNEVLPEEVRAAFYKAETFTPLLSAKWRLRNPYAHQRTSVITDF